MVLKRCGHHHHFDGVSREYKRALMAVIFINAVMFLVEMPMGFFGQSQALKADALDFLSDTFTYSLSLFVIGRSVKLRSWAALIKGISLAILGVWVLGSTFWAIIVLETPVISVMGGVAFMALMANLTSVVILSRFKDGDANVRSVWLCSRNDALSNVAVIGAAFAVWLTNTAWPDLIAATFIAFVFVTGSFQIIKQSLSEMQTAES